jgi:esterase/lipase
LTKQYSYAFQFRNQLKGNCTDLYRKLEKLHDYQKENYKYCDNTIFEAMLELASANNLYDFEIYSLYKEIEDVLEKLPFINSLMRYVGGYNDNVMPSVVDLMKYYKYKVDLQKYNLRIDDEIVTPVTEELIEELAN